MALSIPLPLSGESVSPGALFDVVNDIERNPASQVILEGEVYASELAELKRLPSAVEALDLSNLTILESIGDDEKYGGDIIPPYTFFGSKIKTVKLPNALKGIGAGAFAESSLENIDIPGTLQQMDDHTFYLCKALKSIDFSQSAVRNIPSFCFYGCTSLSELSIMSIESIEEKAFMNSGLKSADLSAVKRIGPFAFASMPYLEAVTLDNGVEIGVGAFYGNKLLSDILESYHTAPELMLAGSAVDSEVVKIDSEIVESGAFAGIKCNTIKVGPGVKEIKRDAFRSVKNLSVVDVISCGATPPALDSEGFAGVDISEVILRVLAGEESVWKSADGWKEFLILQPAGVTEAGLADDVKIRSVGNSLEITSSSDIQDVSVYSVGGVILHRATPNTVSYHTPELEGPVVIVKIITTAVTKVSTISLGH